MYCVCVGRPLVSCESANATRRAGDRGDGDCVNVNAEKRRARLGACVGVKKETTTRSQSIQAQSQAMLSTRQLRTLLRRLILAVGAAAAISILLRLRQRLLRDRFPPLPAPVPAAQPLAPPSGRCVAVTGANGHLGSTIVELLLLRGHRVRACVRGKPSSEAYAFLKRTAAALGASDSFSIAGDCVLAPGCAPAFERAFAGCDAVVHTAMPMDNSGLVFGSEEYRALRTELIEATSGVLEAAAAAGVRTVVHTSSSTAVIGRVVDGRAYNEADWSDEQPGTSSYGHLKAAIERTAVEWHARHQTSRDETRDETPFRLVRICPPAIVGASSAASVNEFVKVLVTSPLTEPLKWASVPTMRLALCTLRDAALAHALALENEAAHGRFCIGDEMLSASAWLAALRAAGYCWPTYPTLHLPVPGPEWLVTPLFRALLGSSLVRALLGFQPDEVRSVLTILGTSAWSYDCRRAQRELAPAGVPPFAHASATAAGVEAARALEARGMLSGLGGQTTPQGRAWVPPPWEPRYCAVAAPGPVEGERRPHVLPESSYPATTLW